MEISKAYDPKQAEEKIYKLWEESGFFNPDNLPGKRKENFSIIMPPPNANGALHIGHAIFVTLQDIMIRYQRMLGKKTLWVPGADHAGFETQVVYEKKLEKEGRSRFQIPRDQLYKEILEFTLTNKKVMENQLKKLGASCDWSRERFTLDPKIVEVVYKTFEKLKADDLLYKGKRIVNWCPKHRTSLSDLEVRYEDRTSPLYYIKYPLENSNNFITVATTRPETMLGDTAVAVNPKDKRYNDLIGKTAILPLANRKIPIIADEAIDLEFGTGVVKTTPAHDPIDFEISQRHNLRLIQVIGFDGKMNESTGIYSGLPTEEARKKIIENLEKLGLIEKIDPEYKNRVSLCYKCGRIIEPLPLDNQWFIKMIEKPKSGGLSLRDAAVKAVKSGKVKFTPKRFEKVFFHWMKNLKDWNISRQIVWGIPIPDEVNGTRDVFDTWFSSGQWPFATLMTGQKDDFKNFYPTSVMETGWDILFFWVSRMIMLGLYSTGKAPFKNVYLHGLVRDKDRQKMSKSKGNVIDPLGVAEIYGTDAVRMALTIGNTPGNDIIIFEEKIRGYRNFANKIWNASRFVLSNTADYKATKKPALSVKDKKHLKALEKIVKDTTKLMDSLRFYSGAEKIYHYFWHTFCDKIIEENKKRLAVGAPKKERLAAQYLLLEILTTSIKLLHPFMPFVTEEIYQQLPIAKKQRLLMIESWPSKQVK